MTELSGTYAEKIRVPTVVSSPGGTDSPSDPGGRITEHAPHRRLSNLPMVVGEVIAAIFAALLPLVSVRFVRVDPVDRVGQVSGLAALQLQFAVIAVTLIAILIVTTTVGRPTAFRIASNLVCAAAAGLAGGLVGAGVQLALLGTSWPLFALVGDSGRLVAWANSLIAGHPIPAEYPPLLVHLLAWWSELTGSSTAFALRLTQIVLSGLLAAAAYISWRLLLPPVCALAIGVVASMPLTDPYKPYSPVVLVTLLPIGAKFLEVLRGSGSRSWLRLAVCGVGFGSLAGVLFLTYSGWFIWSAGGFMAALLVVFPWRIGALRALSLLGVTGACFMTVASSYLAGLLDATGSAKDRYFYFDTYVEPTYIAMWRSDLPGHTGPWPPPGELAGVGLFSVLLLIGLGVAVGFGRHSTVVMTTACILVSAWLMRFWFASRMYATGAVQLYPRTAGEILYCLLVLSGYGAWLLVQRRATDIPRRCNRDPCWRSVANVHIGVLCSFLLFAAMAGSATADRYMPRADHSAGLLAYVAHGIRQPDGRCPARTVPGGCVTDPAALMQRIEHDRK